MGKHLTGVKGEGDFCDVSLGFVKCEVFILGRFVELLFHFYLHLSPAQLHNTGYNDDKEGKELGVGEDVLRINK